MPQAKDIITMSMLSSSRKHWLNIAIIVLLTTFFIAFALSNLLLVDVTFLGVTSQPIPFYIPIFIAFLLGFSGGMLSLSFSLRKHKKEISHFLDENKILHKEVENRRNIPFQDGV